LTPSLIFLFLHIEPIAIAITEFFFGRICDSDEEFKSLTKMDGRFDFLGWWKGNCDRWYLNRPLEKTRKLDDNMALLRRK
jgi:predicted Ser/Thr protein kinase